MLRGIQRTITSAQISGGGIVGIRACCRFALPYGGKDGGERLYAPLFDYCHIDRMPQLLRYGGYSAIGNAARNDVLELAEIVVHIERKAVHCYPPRSVDANSANFALLRYPYPGQSRNTAGCNAEGCQQADNAFLDRSKKPVEVFLELAEVENGIPDQLPRIVERDIATPFDWDNGNIFRPGECLRNTHVLSFANSSQRNYGRMLAQNQGTPPLPLLHLPQVLPLSLPRRLVGNEAPIFDRKRGSGINLRN